MHYNAKTSMLSSDQCDFLYSFFACFTDRAYHDATWSSPVRCTAHFCRRTGSDGRGVDKMARRMGAQKEDIHDVRKRRIIPLPPHFSSLLIHFQSLPPLVRSYKYLFIIFAGSGNSQRTHYPLKTQRTSLKTLASSSTLANMLPWRTSCSAVDPVHLHAWRSNGREQIDRVYCFPVILAVVVSECCCVIERIPIHSSSLSSCQKSMN